MPREGWERRFLPGSRLFRVLAHGDPVDRDGRIAHRAPMDRRAQQDVCVEAQRIRWLSTYMEAGRKLRLPMHQLVRIQVSPLTKPPGLQFAYSQATPDCRPSRLRCALPDVDRTGRLKRAAEQFIRGQSGQRLGWRGRLRCHGHNFCHENGKRTTSRCWHHP